MKLSNHFHLLQRSVKLYFPFPIRPHSVITKHRARSSVVVMALCYKVGGECIFFFFSISLILPAALGPGVYSASNRNEYQKQRNNVTG
jgi:hypothetical protein